MTCISAYKQGGIVYIGGDSAGVSGLDVTIRKDEKVFRKGKFVFGFTSSFRMGQLLRYNLIIPEKNKKISDEEYMTTLFIDAVRDCLKEGGYTEIDKQAEHGGKFIVGYNGEIYTIESDFQVGISTDNFASCGCGGLYADTTFYNLRKSIKKPREKRREALKAAEYFSAGERGPFNIIQTKYNL